MKPGARSAWARARRNPQVVAGAVIVGVIVVCAIFADLIATQPTEGFFPGEGRQGPGREHLFGTDVLGRDIFSRVVHGARSALQIAGAVVGIIMVAGIVVGGIAGYAGGWVDTLLSRVIDVFLAFPVLIGATLIATALGRGRAAVIAGVAAFSWVTVARLFRSSVIAIRGAAFVDAARTLGAGHARILVRHILPNAIGPSLVYSSALVAAAIVAEAALSFLGLGVQEPAASWGLMIASGQQYLRTHAHMVLFPGLALSVTVFGFVMIGEGLRDVLDPEGGR